MTDPSTPEVCTRDEPPMTATETAPAAPAAEATEAPAASAGTAEPGVLRLNTGTHRLLNLCDGTRTVGDILSALSPAPEADVIGALVRLRGEGAVVLEHAVQGGPS